MFPRTLFIILASILLPLSVSAQSAQNTIDEVVWVVGDEAILRSDVENARLELRGEQLEGDPYCVIPEQLAVTKLFLHQAAIDSIEVTDKDVYQQVDRQMEYYVQSVGGREKLEEYFNSSYNSIRERMCDMMREQEMVRQVRQSLTKNIKVTPAQVRKYFKDMPEDSLPFIPTTVECQLIVHNPVIEPEEIERVKNELRGYTERVNSGKDKFSTLALMYSEDGSASKGGELGLSGRGAWVPEFANAAFSLNDPNIVSKIVETDFGFHILQLIEKRGDKVNVRHILRKPRVSDAAFTKCISNLDSISDEIRRGLYTFEECTQWVSQDKETRNNYGIMHNPNDNSSRFEMKDLPTEVARAVASMNINEISKPFIMVNPKTGKDVVAIVKLKNRVNGHRATMKDDYQVLQNVMIERLSEEKIEAWIREKQASTYIHINEGWESCEFKYPGWIH